MFSSSPILGTNVCLPTQPPATPWQPPLNPLTGGSSNDRRRDHAAGVRASAATLSAFSANPTHSSRISTPRRGRGGPAHRPHTAQVVQQFRNASTSRSTATGPFTENFLILLLPHGVCTKFFSRGVIFIIHL